MSASALEGIKVNGLAWRAEINLLGQTSRLGDEDALKVGDCLQIRDTIVRQVQAFVDGQQGRKLERLERLVLASVVEDISVCPDDPDELKKDLTRLFDQFDYMRVCVVG